MQLDSTTIPATDEQRKLAGRDEFVLTPQDKLKIRTVVNGEEIMILDERVPEGKTWSCRLLVFIEETDA